MNILVTLTEDQKAKVVAEFFSDVQNLKKINSMKITEPENQVKQNHEGQNQSPGFPVSTLQCAQLLDISPQTVTRYVRKEAMPVERGRPYKFDMKKVYKWWVLTLDYCRA